MNIRYRQLILDVLFALLALSWLISGLQKRLIRAQMNRFSVICGSILLVAAIIAFICDLVKKDSATTSAEPVRSKTKGAGGRSYLFTALIFALWAAIFIASLFALRKPSLFDILAYSALALLLLIFGTGRSLMQWSRYRRTTKNKIQQDTGATEDPGRPYRSNRPQR